MFKYSDVRNKIKEIKGIKFHINPVYNEKYIKAKVREYNAVIKTNFFSTQLLRLPLVTYRSLCSTCVTYRTPCHANDHQVLPTQILPREAEDFPTGEHSKHVPLLTYLA